MARERSTDDGTYPEVEDELAKVAERAAAAAPPAVDPKAFIAAHWVRRTRAAAAGFFRTVGVPVPDDSCVDELAKLLRLARDGALEEAATAIELISSPAPEVRYTRGIRAMKTES